MSLAERIAVEVGEEPARSAAGIRRKVDGFDLFGAANGVDTVAVLDWLGVSHEESARGVMATCPGCGEDGALVCKDGGVKCLHDRCAHVGPAKNRGFRTPVDLVMHVRQIADAPAARAICDRFGIEVPKTTPAPDLGPWPTDADAPDAPPIGVTHLPDRNGGEPIDPDASQKPQPPPVPVTPADVVVQWRAGGPLIRIPTGIEALDKLCRGGLPIPWRVLIIGAPSAGKTFEAVIIADRLARGVGDDGACVGILAVDEEPEDVTVRLAQIAGFTVADAELRAPAVLDDMHAALEKLRVRLYDARFTIEAAAADVAAWSKEAGRPGALFIDSIQAVRSNGAPLANSPREIVEANVHAMRVASSTHRLLVVATSEANRASYRNDDAAQSSNDLAAGAESRAIEFGAQTLLMLRTPKDQPDIIHARVAKNRRAYGGEFWLRLDRERHAVTECPDPAANPEAAAERAEQGRASVRADVSQDAKTLAKLLGRHPGGLGERELRAELRKAGHKWGVQRLDAARLALLDGAVSGLRLDERQDGRRKVSRLVQDDETEGRS